MARAILPRPRDEAVDGMQPTEMQQTSQANASTLIDLSPVHRSEATIREHLLSGEFERVTGLCQSLYTDALGRYCMAILGDTTTAARASLDTWDRLLTSSDITDEKRTIRSVILGLARKRCAYLLETETTAETKAKSTVTRTDPLGVDAAAPLAVAARDLLSGLRPTERELLVLRYVSNLTYEEIATIIAVDLETTKLRVSSAMARLLLLSKENA